MQEDIVAKKNGINNQITGCIFHFTKLVLPDGMIKNNRPL